jgi:phage terminase large subunit-like protein
MALSKPEQYIADVMSGKIVAGELVKLAIKRHLSDLKKKSLFILLTPKLACMQFGVQKHSSTTVAN